MVTVSGNPNPTTKYRCEFGTAVYRFAKNYRRNLQGNFLSAPPAHQVHPQAEQEAVLGNFAGRGIFGGLISSFRPSFEGDK